MTTLTATTAAEQLLADVRQMLARHDGAETVDELRELADELTTALRRVRGRINRLAKKDEQPAAPTLVAPSAPRPNETAPNVAPSAPVEPAPSQPQGQHAPTAGTAPAPEPTGTPPPATPTVLPRKHRRWWRPAVIVAAVLLMLAVLVAVARADGYLFPPSVDNPVADRGCVIRFDEKTTSGNTRPRIHANSTHYCIGVTNVYAEYPTGDLIIEMDPVGPIVSINVTEDETLTARGIACGPSGGAVTVRIRCYDRSGTKVKAYSSKMYGRYSNLWFATQSWSQ